VEPTHKKKYETSYYYENVSATSRGLERLGLISTPVTSRLDTCNVSSRSRLGQNAQCLGLVSVSELDVSGLVSVSPSDVSLTSLQSTVNSVRCHQARSKMGVRRD
jgi:hypothetical protein